MNRRRQTLLILALLAGLITAGAAGAARAVESAETAGDAAAAEAGAAEGEAEHAYSGIRGDLVLWSIVTFVVFIFAIRKLGWSSFVDSLKSREQTIAGLVADAERTHQEAEQVLREHRGRLEAVDEVTREMLAEARRDAEYTRDSILAAGRAEAESLRQRALREIGRARDQALDEIFDTLTDRVTEATHQRLATRLTTQDQNRLIDEALAGLTA